MRYTGHHYKVSVEDRDTQEVEDALWKFYIKKMKTGQTGCCGNSRILIHLDRKTKLRRRKRTDIAV